MGATDSQVHVPSIVNIASSKLIVQHPKRLQKTNLHTNAWRLTDYEFHTLSSLFSFTLEACCDPDGINRHGLLPYYFERDYFLIHDIVGQSV